MEYHHIVIRVPDGRIEEWDRHLAATFPTFAAPAGFLIVIARDDERHGVYYMTSVLADREKVFADVREAGGGAILLHPLLAQFDAEIVSRQRATVSGLAAPRWSFPS